MKIACMPCQTKTIACGADKYVNYNIFLGIVKTRNIKIHKVTVLSSSAAISANKITLHIMWLKVDLHQMFPVQNKKIRIHGTSILFWWK